MDSKREAAGWYTVTTAHGTYEVMRFTGVTGFTGPCWGVTHPGRYGADLHFPSKRDAMRYVRMQEEMQAD